MNKILEVNLLYRTINLAFRYKPIKKTPLVVNL